MKLGSVVWVGLGVFVGVLGALRADEAVDLRAQASPPLLAASPAAARPAAFETAPSAPDFRAAVKRVVPSVVSVDRYEQVSRGFFDEPGDVEETASGSGVVVSDSGLIVTNNHVVAGAQEVRVRTSDNRAFTAKVVGTDSIADLAVLKIDATGLTPIELGRSAEVEVGQWVLAVGNPLGFNNTVSVGVVSSLKRDLPVGAGGLVNAIQTDAAINPGNSGGALTDAQGRLIGINTAIASGTGQSVGIGFAIPVDRVRTVVNDIVRLGYARYASLGAATSPRYDGVLADPQVRAQLAEITGAVDVPSRGVIVFRTGPAAARAGLSAYDVILRVAGVPVENTTAIAKVLLDREPGQTVEVQYWSRGEVKSARLTLSEIRPS